jgi:uncharacterized protein YjbI with pentapeptide repeats
VIFRYARLENARLDGCHFGFYSDFSFSCARQLKCNFSVGGRLDFGSADLTGARFVNSMMPDANFKGAIVTGADFTGVHMARVDPEQLRSAKLTRVWFEED